MNVLYETLVGSHLYGTNTPESDLDICGVYVPSKEEILGISRYPDEVDRSQKISDGPRNTAGDVDCKYYSIKRFLQLAIQGQPAAIEMLFSRPIDARHATAVWVSDMVWLRDNAIISKKCIAPFLGFAQAQAEKMVRRGEKYNDITKVLARLNELTGERLTETLLANRVSLLHDVKDWWVHTNDHGYQQLCFAGSDYDVGISLRTFKKQLQRKEERYGTRSKAAALEHLDYKSLLHCMRLLYQAEEFIATGKITLPLRSDHRDFLLSIKRREWPTEGQDVFSEVTARIASIRQDCERSKSLRPTPLIAPIEGFLIDVHEKAITGLKFPKWPAEIITQ